MNKSCIACAESKLRCDLDKDSPCSRCLHRGSPCVKAERKKRAKRAKGTRSTSSLQTASENTSYQSADLGALNEPSIDLSTLGTPSADELHFLSQLADIENSVDMSSWAWRPQDISSIFSDASLSRNRIGAPTYELVAGEFLCPDNFRLPADYTLELDGLGTVPVHRLEILARLFFTHFHPFFPILHIPTFCLASSPSVLVRAICFIGTGFDSDPASISDARLFYGSLPSLFAKCCLHP
jgi:hypothetical protein